MSPNPVARALADFAPVPVSPVLAIEESDRLLDTLRATPPSFTHPELPTVWGRAFETFARFQDYLRVDDAISTLEVHFSSFVAEVARRFAAEGYAVAPLRTPDGRVFPAADVRVGAVPQGMTTLHMDDLARDGSWMPDFSLPPALSEEPWVQLSVLQWLAAAGDGVLRVYDHRYTPRDDIHRLANGWQFADAAVAGRRFAELRPVAGTTLVMNNHHLHDVRGGDRDDTWTFVSTYALVQPRLRRVFLYI